MNIEITDLDIILNYLETTSLEPHDEYTSEFTYKDQKILYKYIKEIQQENQQLKEQLHEASLQIQEMIEQDLECPSNCSKLKELKKQQKKLWSILKDV